MSVVSMKDLLEAGVHFGHTTKRWNPKMKEYIYTARSGIYIIDLKRTAEEINKAYVVMRDIVSEGGKVLFVGTKKQAQEAVKEEAERTGMFYVDQRWLGGTLTNFATIRRRIRYLHELYEMEEKGRFDLLPKKEVANLIRQRTRLEKLLGGIKEMREIPQAIFIIDPKKEINAIREARILGIPVFGIVDTNCDPDDVDYVIPANDDAIRAVKLIVGLFGNAIIEGQGGMVEEAPQKPRETKEQQAKRATHMTGYQTHEPEEVKEEPKKEVKKPVVKKEEPKVEEVKVEEPKVEEPKAEETVDLNALKVVELRELAKEKGITGYSTMRKAELIDALK